MLLQAVNHTGSYRYEVVRELLAQPRNAAHAAAQDNAAISVAVRNRDWRVAELLVRHGADERLMLAADKSDEDDEDEEYDVDGSSLEDEEQD